MKNETIKLLPLVMAVILCAGLLTGCGGKDVEPDNTTASETESQPDTTEEEGGIVGENGKKLMVDYETPGTIAEDAPDIASTTLVIHGVSLEMPFQTSALVDSGWTFYSEDVGQQMVAANTEASMMGFSMYLNETAYVDLGSVINNDASQKPVLECSVTRLTINLLDSMEDDGFDFVLPGGITKDSTAADVLAAYGDVLENENFEYVQVGNTMLYYADQKESGLNFYFGFHEDGTLDCVTVSS